MLQIVAHEIGHNLGMLHDFNGGNTNSQRYEGGQLCTNVGGIMDYRSNPYRWSACSVGDFTRYYNRVRNERPNDGYRPTYPFCLQAAEAATTTTTTTTTPETTTTIDASCIATCISSWTAADTPACVKTTLCTDSCAKGVCTQCDCKVMLRQQQLTIPKTYWLFKISFKHYVTLKLLFGIFSTMI